MDIKILEEVTLEKNIPFPRGLVFTIHDDATGRFWVSERFGLEGVEATAVKISQSDEEYIMEVKYRKLS